MFPAIFPVKWVGKNTTIFIYSIMLNVAEKHEECMCISVCSQPQLIISFHCGCEHFPGGEGETLISTNKQIKVTSLETWIGGISACKFFIIFLDCFIEELIGSFLMYIKILYLLYIQNNPNLFTSIQT